MTVSGLMDALAAHGATLTVTGDSMKVRAATPLPDALMAALRARKTEILGALQDSSGQGVHSLPPVHDADDPWQKPTAPCAVCGQARWRVWSHDETHVWQWICNGCRPLVVINPDGTRWRT